MKRAMVLFGFVVAGVLGCDPYQCSTVRTTARCGSLKACCTATQCEYRTDTGGNFVCDGTSCEAAARRAVSACN